MAITGKKKKKFFERLIYQTTIRDRFGNWQNHFPVRDNTTMEKLFNDRMFFMLKYHY